MVRGLLIAGASLVWEHGLKGVQASVAATQTLEHRLIVVAPRLSRSKAHAIFPDQGCLENLCPLH